MFLYCVDDCLPPLTPPFCYFLVTTSSIHPKNSLDVGYLVHGQVLVGCWMSWRHQVLVGCWAPRAIRFWLDVGHIAHSQALLDVLSVPHAVSFLVGSWISCVRFHVLVGCPGYLMRRIALLLDLG